MNLNEIAIFVKIVETGSFVGAANFLQMPKSTVSAKLSSLEHRLGVTLIRRTTRKLHVTEAGNEYYQECLKAMVQIQAAEEKVTSRQSVLIGPLKITAPTELGVALLPQVILEFNKKYPKINLEVILTNRSVDLVSEGIDIGIRTGALKDSSLIAKRLGTIYFAPFASPKYFKTFSEPKNPKELENHCTLQFAPLGNDEWHLVGPKGKQTIGINKTMIIDDLNLIKTLAVSGLGIALMPTFLCLNEVKNGKLVRILDNWRTDLRPVHFIYPSQKYISPKIKAFIEVSTEILKRNLDNSEL